MPWGKRTDDFVTDPVQFQVFLKKSGLFPVGGKTVGKFSVPLSVEVPHNQTSQIRLREFILVKSVFSLYSYP